MNNQIEIWTSNDENGWYAEIECSVCGRILKATTWFPTEREARRNATRWAKDHEHYCQPH